MKVAVSLIIVLFLVGIAAFFIIPFLLQNIYFPGFSPGGVGVAGIFKSNDGGDFWFLRNNIEGSKSTISSIDILDFAFDPFDSNIIYLGTDGAGIYKSVNNGETWRQLVDDNNILSAKTVVNQIAFDARDSSHMIAAVFKNNNGMIIETKDGGRNWKQLYIAPVSKQDIKTIIIDPTNPNLLYAGTSSVSTDSNYPNIYTGTTAGGFLMSSDGGQSWRALNWFPGPIQKIVINPAKLNELFVIIKNKGVYRTNNRGADWTDLTQSFSQYSRAVQIENLVIDPSRSNVVYMTSAYGLLRSDDSGNSWRVSKILVPPEALPVQDIAIDKNNFKKIYMSAGSKIYVSDDEGENWSVKSLDTGKKADIVRVDPKNSKVIFVGIHK